MDQHSIDKVFREAQRWYEEGLHTDFDMTAECGAELRLHKLILSARSSYFSTLLDNAEMNECKSGTVHFPQFSAPVLKEVVHHMYYNRFDDGRAQAYHTDILQCADYLGVPAAVHTCSEIIIKQELCVDNFLDVAFLFRAHSLTSAYGRAMSFGTQHFEEIMQQKFDEPWKMELLMEVWGRGEYELFCYLTDGAEEHGFSPDALLEEVRFGLMSARELQNVKSRRTYRLSKGSWKDLLRLAEQYATLTPVTKKVVFYGDQHQNKPRHEPDRIVLFSRLTRMLDERTELDILPIDYMDVLDATHIDNVYDYDTANGFLILRRVSCPCDWTGTYPHENWAIYDAQNNAIIPMSNPYSLHLASGRADGGKVGCTVVYHLGFLYSLGGTVITYAGVGAPESKTAYSIDKYDFATDSWCSVSNSVVPGRMAGCSGCSIGQNIYIAGGCSTDGAVKDVWRYDVVSGDWVAVTKLAKPFLNQGATMQLSNYGQDSFAYLNKDYNVSVYNTVTEDWYELTIPYTLSLDRAHDPAAIFVTKSAVYVHLSRQERLCVYYRDGSDRYSEKHMFVHSYRRHVIF